MLYMFLVLFFFVFFFTLLFLFFFEKQTNKQTNKQPRRFGFANREALEAGQTGIACRGEEHDVTLVWSITSGKRLLLADGHEVHYSMVRSQTFEFSWTMKGNHVLKVVAHAAPPAQRIPGFRQYDFFVDGKSFFTMPKVYRLGMVPETNNTNYPSRTAGGTTSNDPLPAAHRSPTYNNYTLAERDRAAVVTTPIVALETPHNAEEVRLIVLVLVFKIWFLPTNSKMFFGTIVLFYKPTHVISCYVLVFITFFSFFFTPFLGTCLSGRGYQKFTSGVTSWC
jgi:hypothetical protein